MLSECVALIAEAWNPYNSREVKFLGGVGAMRNKRGEIVEQSLIQNDYWQFQVGLLPPIMCTVDSEGNVTLSKYSTAWLRLNQAFETPTENNP